jgi:hypothetical protein
VLSVLQLFLSFLSAVCRLPAVPGELLYPTLRT